MSKASERPPTISVVMSVFNGGEFLAQAIQSILDQTFRNFEFIIIDDGSTDDSEKVIKRFDDPRIILIQQKNTGLVASLNKGIKIAKGEFIARMDADDISLPQRFEKELIAITANHSIGVVGSFYTYIDYAGNPYASHVSPTLHQDLRFILLHVNPFGHGSVLIRKEALVKIGLYRDDYPAAEDYDLWRRMAHDWLLVQIPESLYWWRQNPEGVSVTRKKAQEESTCRIVQELWKEVIPAMPALIIRRHHKYYKNLDTAYTDQIAKKYLSSLVQISLGAAARHKPRTFLKTAGGLVLTSPRQTCKLLYLMMKSLIKKILTKMRIYSR